MVKHPNGGDGTRGKLTRRTIVDPRHIIQPRQWGEEQRIVGVTGPFIPHDATASQGFSFN